MGFAPLGSAPPTYEASGQNGSAYPPQQPPQQYGEQNQGYGQYPPPQPGYSQQAPPQQGGYAPYPPQQNVNTGYSPYPPQQPNGYGYGNTPAATVTGLCVQCYRYLIPYTLYLNT